MLKWRCDEFAPWNPLVLWVTQSIVATFISVRFPLYFRIELKMQSIKAYSLSFYSWLLCKYKKKCNDTNEERINEDEASNICIHIYFPPVCMFLEMLHSDKNELHSIHRFFWEMAPIEIGCSTISMLDWLVLKAFSSAPMHVHYKQRHIHQNDGNVVLSAALNLSSSALCAVNSI